MSPDFTVRPSPEQRRRPAVVLVSTVALATVPLCAAVYLVAQIVLAGSLRAALEEALAGTPDEEFVDVMVAFAGAFNIGAGVVYLLFGLTLGILSIFNSMGKNGSRITTWVVGGLGLCCGGLALADAASGAVLELYVEDDLTAADNARIDRIIEAHLPSWYDPVVLVTNTVGVLAVAVALVLLMLPPSNEYFRKRPAGGPGQPPFGYPPVGPQVPPQWPGQPPSSHGYPQSQGYPQPSGYPYPPGYPQPSGYPPPPPSYPQPQQSPPGQQPPPGQQYHQPPARGDAGGTDAESPPQQGSVHDQPTTLGYPPEGEEPPATGQQP